MCKGGDTAMLKRININLDEKLLLKIDAYAENIGVNRTAAIIFLINAGLEKLIDSEKK